MGEEAPAVPVAGLAEVGRISADDVRLLRTETYRDGVVDRSEAEKLFALNAAYPDQCQEWRVFFIEALSDHIVQQQKPSGYVTEDQAAWLLREVSHGALVGSELELELLVTILERAKSSPVSLCSFALEQVAFAIIDGEGPLAAARVTASGGVERHEVDLIRRILHAFGGDGNISVTRAEADILFRINDGTDEAKNHPCWSELFVKAVANFVLASSGYEVPSRAEALARDAFFEKADANIGAFFARMVSGGVAGLIAAYSSPDEAEPLFEERNRARDARSQAGVQGDEARWLAKRITHDRLIRENERALLGFIRQASPAVHPELKALLDDVA